jgi:hypothetical protein
MSIAESVRYPQHQAALAELYAARQRWATKSVKMRLALLQKIKHQLRQIAPQWVQAASAAKGLPAGSPLTGEEWFAGPVALMAGCHGLMVTLAQMTDKAFLQQLPGHSLADIQSGRGTVHNSFMLESTERTVLEAPFQPFPRGLLRGELSLLPKPPWFINHQRQDDVARRLLEFYYRPGWRKLPRIFWQALRG